MKDKVREIIAQTIGEASMQWSEIPKGVYDSSAACKLIDRTIDKLNSLKPSVEEIEKRTLGELLPFSDGEWRKGFPDNFVWDELNVRLFAKRIAQAIDRLNKEM